MPLDESLTREQFVRDEPMVVFDDEFVAGRMVPCSYRGLYV